MEDKKEEKKKDWEALKRGCFIYKEKLDMRIRGDFHLDNEDITVTFFYKKYDDKYYVHLSRDDKIWKGLKTSLISTVIYFFFNFFFQIHNIFSSFFQ